jgi:hypothetical protein
MQGEILAANPGSSIRLFAVNDQGYESGVPLAYAGGETLPILQDTYDVVAWTLWAVQYRDLVILDGDGNALGVLNLTDHDLQVQSEYDDLLDYLRIKAGE